MFFRISSCAAAVAALLTLASCATEIDYFGESYPPTYNVGVFFNSSDLKQPYKIMGKAIATPGAFASKADFQNDLINDARMHGADAVLVESFNRIKTGEVSNWNNDGYAKAHKKDAWWTESGSASTQDVTTLQATVYYVKYTAK
jgi:hypothetical protein